MGIDALLSRVRQIGRNLGNQPTHARGLLILERSTLRTFQVFLGMPQERPRVLVPVVGGRAAVVARVAHRRPSSKRFRRVGLGACFVRAKGTRGRGLVQHRS